MALKLAVSCDQLIKDFGQRFLHRQPALAHRLALNLCDGLGRADAGHHVFALGVDQIFAIE